MIVIINTEDKIEYNSVYISMYKKDELTLRYNKSVYDIYEYLLKTDTVWFEKNIESVFINAELINVQNIHDRYILLSNVELVKFTEDKYYNDFIVDGKLDTNNGLYVNTTVPKYDTLINNKYKLIFNIVVKYNNYFEFTFDGDTGDTTAGSDIKIKDFNSNKMDKDIIGATVQWKNKNGDVETHNITNITDDKTSIQLDGDIKDTADTTLAKRINLTYGNIEYVNENKILIKG